MKLLVPLTVTVLLMALGVAAVLYGGYDDAPGLQLIGVTMFLVALVGGGRAVWRATR